MNGEDLPLPYSQIWSSAKLMWYTVNRLKRLHSVNPFLSPLARFQLWIQLFRVVIKLLPLITPTEYEIGCFKTPQDLFSETLGDFTQEADASKTLMECKELTKQSGFNVFALGHGGLCMSGPNAQDTYYRYKPASKKNKCSNGIGIGDHSVVYTFGIYKSNNGTVSVPLWLLVFAIITVQF